MVYKPSRPSMYEIHEPRSVTRVQSHEEALKVVRATHPSATAHGSMGMARSYQVGGRIVAAFEPLGGNRRAKIDIGWVWVSGVA